MGELIKFEIGELPDILIVGKEIRHSMEALMKGDNPIPAFWDLCFSEGIFAELEDQSGNIHDPAYVGVMVDWDRGDGDFSYIVGMLMKTGADVPDGFICREVNATKVAIGWIKGADVADVCSKAHEYTEKALKAEGFTCKKITWCMELYNCPRFTEPDENGDIILDYYIPID